MENLAGCRSHRTVLSSALPDQAGHELRGGAGDERPPSG